MSPEPFDSRAKALPAKRNEKGYGDENDLPTVTMSPMLNGYWQLVKKRRSQTNEFPNS